MEHICTFCWGTFFPAVTQLRLFDCTGVLQASIGVEPGWDKNMQSSSRTTWYGNHKENCRPWHWQARSLSTNIHIRAQRDHNLCCGCVGESRLATFSTSNLSWFTGSFSSSFVRRCWGGALQLQMLARIILLEFVRTKGSYYSFFGGLPWESFMRFWIFFPSRCGSMPFDDRGSRGSNISKYLADIRSHSFDVIATIFRYGSA
jgi:hypothetical protein